MLLATSVLIRGISGLTSSSASCRMKTEAEAGMALRCSGSLSGQHDVDARRQDAVDLGNGPGKLLAQRVDHLRAFLHGRGDEAFLLEHGAEGREFRLGQARPC